MWAWDNVLVKVEPPSKSPPPYKGGGEKEGEGKNLCLKRD